MATYTSSDGFDLFYTDEGEGLPVLCLSGLTRSGRDFDFVAPHLAGVRLIRPDYRGRGQSEWGDWQTYTIPREALDAVELLNHLGIDKAAVLGTSRGWLIGMVLGATARDRMLGVALNDIGPVIAPMGITAIMGYLGNPPPWKTHAEALAVWPEVIRGFANVPASRMQEEIERLYLETPEGLKLRYDPHLRDAVLMASHQPAVDLWPLYDSLSGLPLAIIQGVNSDLLSAETLAEMERRIPQAIVARVPDRGHIPYLDEPEALAALSDWLEAMR